MWVRCVLVPDLTDDIETFENLAVYLAALKNVERVEILPFHKMGEHKWAALGLPYQLGETQPPKTELVKQVQDIFRAHGLFVV